MHSGGCRTSQYGHGFLCLPSNATFLEERRRDKQGKRHSSLCKAIKDDKLSSQNQTFALRVKNNAICHGGRSNTAAVGDTVQIYGEPKSNSWLPGSNTAAPTLPRSSLRAFPGRSQIPQHWTKPCPLETHALERKGPALLCSPCSSWTGHWGENCWFIHWNDQTQLRASLQQESSSQCRFHWNNHELLLELHMSTPGICNTACQSRMPGVGPTFLCLMARESSWSPNSTCWAPVEAQLPSPS